MLSTWPATISPDLSLGEKAGLLLGDTILKINSEEPTSHEHAATLLTSALTLELVLRRKVAVPGAAEPAVSRSASKTDKAAPRNNARPKLSLQHMQLLNIAAEWLRVFLPHCLQKIHRVTFGLLSPDDYKRLAKTEPHMPRSRIKLAIPFLGKDVPSNASEFAHPDIIIGLSVLAYRYYGLRKDDFEQDVMRHLRMHFEKEVGPFRLRKSSLLYEGWVEQAGGLMKGSATAIAATAAADASGDPDADKNVVAPLWLLKESNDEQLQKLFDLLYKVPAVIHW